MRCDARFLVLCLLATTLGACTTIRGRHPSTIVETPADPGKEWEKRIDPAGAQRLAALPALWSSARAAARQRFAIPFAKEGALLDPTRALRYPALPPGSYRCRIVKIGSAGARQSAYRAFPPSFCFVGDEKDGQSFAKQTGTDRPSGWLYPDGETRLVFLGAFAEGKARPPVYGAVPGRDAMGVVERIGHFRWRLTLVPANGSTLTVYDLAPVPVEAQLPVTD
jgi:hypothetical protein